ncbi:hypothetical protein AKN40_1983 [Escherichia coli]|nr:hypothetical protein AKN40_1983 [Escherichia coli]
MIDPHGMTGDTLEIRRQPFPHIHQYAVWYFTACTVYCQNKTTRFNSDLNKIISK